MRETIPPVCPSFERPILTLKRPCSLSLSPGRSDSTEGLSIKLEEENEKGVFKFNYPHQPARSVLIKGYLFWKQQSPETDIKTSVLVNILVFVFCPETSWVEVSLLVNYNRL